MKKKKLADSMFRYVPRAKDLPATQGMLRLVRTELKADIAGLRSETRAGFSQMDARFKQIDAKFHQTDSKFENVLSELARIGLLVEEQNANNRFVLEGLTGLWQRQERVETRVTDVEELVRTVVRPRT